MSVVALAVVLSSFDYVLNYYLFICMVWYGNVIILLVKIENYVDTIIFCFRSDFHLP
jgi:hypothetical protein